MRVMLALLLSATALCAQVRDYSRLPDWAAAVALASQAEPGPLEDEAWVLLDRTEIAYAGDGEIRLRRLRLIKVLEERGTRYRTFFLFGLGGKASRIKRLKGWNLRPDGELAKLDSDKIVSLNDASVEEFSTTTATSVALDRVVKGSLVAFESMEVIQSPIGPVARASLLGALPVRTWELEVAKREGWFTNLQAVEIKIDRSHFLPWVSRVEELPGGGLRVRELPALPKDEGAHPYLDEVLPVVQVRFLDPKWPQAAMWESWDAFARWQSAVFEPACQPSGLVGLPAGKGLEGLRALWNWMQQGLSYKQVYLTPERGWMPEPAPEVGRKRYGDCKDLTAFFLGEAKGQGLEGAPVLASISEGLVSSEQAPLPRFNHVISALRLRGTLGLPAEVDTPQGRFLLVDPTDTLTPFGSLSNVHSGRKVMICLPSGAVWVSVPAACILPSRLVFDLKGEIQGRELSGTLSLRESGGYWGLRAEACRGAKAVREALLRRHLDLPPTALLEVISLSDPMDLERPFAVSLRLQHPEGCSPQGTYSYLTDLGIPTVPGPIQRMGKPRQYPVVSTAQGELSYRAELKFQTPVKPAAFNYSGEDSFRKFTWAALASPEAGGTLLKVTFDHQFTPATFGFSDREQGIKAWKSDRSLMKTFRDEVLALRVGVL